MAEDKQDFIGRMERLNQEAEADVRMIDDHIARFVAVRDAIKSMVTHSESLLNIMRSSSTPMLFAVKDVDTIGEKVAEHDAITMATGELYLRNQDDINPELPLLPPPPMWKIIEKAMRGRPSFTMTEAGEALERELGRKIPNRPQTVRNNLHRFNGKVFRMNWDKSWRVVSSEGDATQD